MLRQILGKVVFILETIITLLTILSVRDISRLTDCNSEDQVLDQFLYLVCVQNRTFTTLFFPGVSTSHASPRPAVKGTKVPHMFRVLREEKTMMVISINSTVNIIDIIVNIVNTYTKVIIIVKGVRARSSGCVEGIAD